MKYKLHIDNVPNCWIWSITDEYGDEVASSNNDFDSLEQCRVEGRSALSDWNREELHSCN